MRVSTLLHEGNYPRHEGNYPCHEGNYPLHEGSYPCHGGTSLSMRVAVLSHEGKLDCHYPHNMVSCLHSIGRYPQGQEGYLHSK